MNAIFFTYDHDRHELADPVAVDLTVLDGKVRVEWDGRRKWGEGKRQSYRNCISKLKGGTADGEGKQTKAKGD